MTFGARRNAVGKHQLNGLATRQPEQLGPAPISASSRRIAITALAFAAFALGSTEFVVVGLLPEIAMSLEVSVREAGILVSLYALTIVLATPFVSAATSHISSNKLLFIIMGIFTAANLAAAAAPNYYILLGARVIMAVAHGAFFSVAATVVASFGDRARAGSANATIMAGVTLAMVVGVPAGAWIGQLFGWRVPFLVVAAMGIISLVLLMTALPPRVGKPSRVLVADQLRQLATPRFAFLYLVTTMAVGATMVFFTYLSPFLTDVTNVSERIVGIALAVFGGATVLGNLVGGRLADRVGWMKAISFELLGLIASLSAAYFVSNNALLLLGAIGLIGFFGFSVPPIMQTAIVETAKLNAAGAVGTASGITVASINLGIAAGSLVGGILLAGSGISATPLVGAAFGFCALVFLRATARN